VDLDEGGISQVFAALGPGRRPPANETSEGRDQRLRRGYEAYLADPRNRSTPDAAVTFLRKLWGNELVSRASTHELLDLMYAQTVPHRLRDGLPEGVRLADKCGAGSASGSGDASPMEVFGIAAPWDQRDET
jgi:beta-lactamase class A